MVEMVLALQEVLPAHRTAPILAREELRDNFSVLHGSIRGVAESAEGGGREGGQGAGVVREMATCHCLEYSKEVNQKGGLAWLVPERHILEVQCAQVAHGAQRHARTDPVSVQL